MEGHKSWAGPFFLVLLQNIHFPLAEAIVYRKSVISSKMVSRICSYFHCFMNCLTVIPLWYFHVFYTPPLTCLPSFSLQFICLYITYSLWPLNNLCYNLSLSFQSLSIPFCLSPFFCFLVPSCLADISAFSPYIIHLRIFTLTSPFPITCTGLSSPISSCFCEVSDVHSPLSSALLPVFGKRENCLNSTVD